MWLLLACADLPAPPSDGLGARVDGLGVWLETTYADGRVEAADPDGVRFRHYDDAGREDHRVGQDGSFEVRDRWTEASGYADARTPAPAAGCATESWSAVDLPGMVHSDRWTRRACEGAWAREAEVLSVGSTDSSWESVAYEAWTRSGPPEAPTRVEHWEGERPDALELTDWEVRSYQDGQLVQQSWEDHAGVFFDTYYDWEDARLVAVTTLGSYRSTSTAWRYDAEGRVAGWWTDVGPSEARYQYLPGTSRPEWMELDLADEDGRLDGEPDAVVRYRWQAGDLE